MAWYRSWGKCLSLLPWLSPSPGTEGSWHLSGLTWTTVGPGRCSTERVRRHQSWREPQPMSGHTSQSSPVSTQHGSSLQPGSKLPSLEATRSRRYRLALSSTALNFSINWISWRVWLVKRVYCWTLLGLEKSQFVRPSTLLFEIYHLHSVRSLLQQSNQVFQASLCLKTLPNSLRGILIKFQGRWDVYFQETGLFFITTQILWLQARYLDSHSTTIWFQF